MVVKGAAKVPFPNRRILAQLLGLPETSVDQIEVDVGGGFGARGEFYSEDFLIPFAARHTGRPVKWTEDRRDHMMTSNHSRDVTCTLEIAARRDGTILALRAEAICDVGAYLRPGGLITPRNVAMFMGGPYRIDNYHVVSKVLLSNKTPSGTYRGPGRYEVDFFRERMIDMMARDLGLDRIEIRRRNLVPPEAMPYTLPPITPAPTPSALDSGDYQVTLDRCLAEIGWRDKLALDGRQIDGLYHGVAIGCFVEGGAAGPKETARLMVGRDGGIELRLGSAAVGQGLATSALQIAADALEVPMDRFTVRHGSTTLLAEGFGAYHSRSVVMGGSAILDAADKLREMIRKEAGRFLNCSPDEVVVEGGIARGPSGRVIPWSELAPLSADGAFLNSRHTYSFGAHATHITIDPGTGSIRLVGLRGRGGRRPHHQSAHAARPVDRRDRAGAGRHAAGASDLRQPGTVPDRVVRRLSVADGHGFSDDPGLRAGDVSVADQSAGRQGRRRGRHHSGRRVDRQCGRVGAGFAEGRAAVPAAVAAPGLAAHRRGACESLIARHIDSRALDEALIACGDSSRRSAIAISPNSRTPSSVSATMPANRSAVSMLPLATSSRWPSPP